MNKVKAFVGHSFNKKDEQIVRRFLDYFDTLSEMGFEWDSAEEAEPKTLSEKVKKKMDGKNLFIGIFTATTMQVCPSKLKENTFFKKDSYSVPKADFKRCTSEWIIQESGYAMGKGMNLIFLIEDVLNTVGGLQGDLGFIRFSRNNPELCFSQINEMISSLVKQQAKTGEEVIEKSKPQEVTETEKTVEETPAELLKEGETKNIIEELFSAIDRGDGKKEVELYGKKLKECEGDKDKEITFKSFYYAIRHKIKGSDELENLSKLSYSKYDKHSSSLHHYKILSENVPNSANWNNLGVEYSNLELGGKAVAAYLKSKEAGGTTSVGNLTNRLIDTGFLDEARFALQEALNKPDFDTNVPKALSRIEEVMDAENKKEEETLSSAIKEREFLIEYAEAFIEPFETRLPLSWKTKYGDVDIKIEGNRFVAKGERKIESTLSLLGFSPYIKRTSDEEMILQKITYQGTIVNRTIDYELTIHVEPVRKFNEATLAGSLLGTKKEKDVYTGIMVINRECNKIEVMEKEPKDKVSFYEITSNDNR